MMKTISAMDMRKHMGEYLDEVRLKSETLILERSGKPVAMLTPIEHGSVGKKDEVKRKFKALQQLRSISAADPRTEDPDKWLKDERDNWGERI